MNLGGRRPALIAVVGLVITTVGLLPAGAATNAALAAAPPPGVVLPSGRLATPAGSTYDAQRATGDAAYDLGDFPLGVALSPDGSLAVTSLNGRGEGTLTGSTASASRTR